MPKKLLAKNQPKILASKVSEVEAQAILNAAAQRRAEGFRTELAFLEKKWGIKVSSQVLLVPK